MIERLNAALEGRYRVLEQIGEGGMAFVYLADDLRHERKVALKVLKPELAAVVGAERFLTEIKTTANLQHPHILPLYDSGEADSFLYYVMPYVAGATLADRLETERQLPVDEAVRVAKAVANALDFAHREGVVHRDIKPANVLFQDGQPVVSDFGIALAVGAGGSARLTETGLSLGTPYYMSPEQATGDQQVGPRSDIYSLGCVLYEMLVGDPPYVGSTAQAVLGKIIQGEPVSATATRKAIPAHVDATIRRALERLPADRFATAAELSAALGNSAFRHGEVVGTLAADPSAVRRWRMATVAACIVALLAVGSIGLGPDTDIDPLQRHPIAAPAALEYTEVQLSPDGSRIAWLIWDENADESDEPRADDSQIWVRERDAIELRPVSGTARADAFAFSPDGKRLAFIVGDTVRTVALDGGRPLTILVGAHAGRPDWADDGYIYLGSSSSDRRHMLRVPEGGGEPSPVPGTGDQGVQFMEGDVLPGSEGMIVAWYEQAFNRELIQYGVLDFATGQRRFLANAVLARYAPSGHIIYLTASGQFMALPFNADRLEVTGDPKLLDEGIVHFAVSDMGDLITYHGLPFGIAYEVAWFDRDGTREPIDWSFGVAETNLDPTLSPDGTKVAVVSPQTDGSYRLKTKDLVTGAERTVGESFTTRVAWSADSRYLGIIEQADTLERLVRIRADGSGRVEPMTNFVPANNLRMGYWSPFDTLLVAGTPGGLNVVSVGDGAWTPMQVGDSIENPMLSPDRQWVAYSGVEDGEWRIFVRPFPNLDEGVWPVSNGEGFQPRWSSDGTEIFYLRHEPTGIQLVAAQVRTDPDFTVLGIEPLFQTQTGNTYLGGGWSYDVNETADRFIAARARMVEPEIEHIILTTHFFAELERRFRKENR